MGVYVCHQPYWLPTGKLDRFDEFTYTEGAAKKGRYDFSHVFTWAPAGTLSASNHSWTTDSAFIAGRGDGHEKQTERPRLPEG